MICVEKGTFRMLRKLLASAAIVLGTGVAWMLSVTPLSVAQAAPAECKSDADCASGTFCILALTPHVCKPPQAAGAACKRDVVCASKKCDIPAGKEAGVCK